MGEIQSATGGLVPGWEFQRMMGVLDGARDLGGAHIPGEAGFTWDGTVNSWMTETSDQSRKRLDYMMVFDDVPGLPAVALHSAQMEVDPFLRDGRHLSDHFAIVTDLRP